MVGHPPRRAQDGPAGQDPPLTLDPGLLARLRAPAGERLLDAAAGADLSADGRLATLQRLRAAAGDDALAAAAYETAVLRRHALAKHPAGDRMWWTREALEQSTSAVVAAHRARRYAVAGTVLDVACSAGADLLALAAAGHPVVGVDLDPLRLALAAANADALDLADGVTLVRADATRLAVRRGAWVFADPARRAGPRRVFDPQRYAPPLGVVSAWAADAAGLGVKTAPGIPHDAVPEGAALELVSLDGDVKEAVLWWGGLHPGVARRATLLPGGATLDPVPGGDGVAVAEPGEWLLEPDGAVVRAGLVTDLAVLLGAWQVDPTIAYLSADTAPATPFARAYRVLEVLPFSLKELRARLRALDAGEVVVKKRGSAVDVDDLRRRLRTTGTRRLVVVLTRVSGRPTALVCLPAAAQAGDAGGEPTHPAEA